MGDSMKLFNKTAKNDDVKVEKVEKNTSSLCRVEDNSHIFERDNELLVWNSNSLVYKIRKKEINFDLDGSLIIEYSNENGLLGDREISFWARRTDKFAQKHTPENWSICNSLYKKVASIMFSKKEADTYLDIFNNLVSCLGDKVNAFSCTKQIKPLKIDDQHFLIKDDINRFLRFSDIIECKIEEDGDTVISGNVGKALVGGALLGPVGAIAGAVSKKKVSATVSSVDFKILLSDTYRSQRIYSLLDKTCKKSDSDYSVAMSRAKQLYSTILAAMHAVSDNASISNQDIKADSTISSPADEILKYKQLLDIGAITEEEYNAKKTQLLNL